GHIPMATDTGPLPVNHPDKRSDHDPEGRGQISDRYAYLSRATIWISRQVHDARESLKYGIVATGFRFRTGLTEARVGHQYDCGIGLTQGVITEPHPIEGPW